MEHDLSKEISLKFKVLGIYQIAGGLIGLGLTILILSKLTMVSVPLLLIFLIAIVLYTYSIYCGTLLVKYKISGLKHSLINQIFQVVNFSVFGFAFQYISGVFLLIGIDLTSSFTFTFGIGLSSWQININSSPDTYMLNFNFVALFLILFIENLKKKISKDQIEKQITSIGQ